MKIFLDNLNLKTHFGVNVMDYSPLFDKAGEREDNYTWNNKSGIQKNDQNSRYNTLKVTLQCYIEATGQFGAYKKLRKLTDYFFNKEIGYGRGVTILTLDNTTERIAFLIERGAQVKTATNFQASKTLFIFDLEILIVNPRAKVFQISGAAASIPYGNSVRSLIYWGDGSSQLMERPGLYEHTYAASGDYTVIIDIDRQDYTADYPNIPIAISPETITSDRHANQREINVVCSSDWLIRDIPNWVTFENDRGQIITGGIGNEIIFINIMDNASMEGRNSQIIFYTVSHEVILTVIQHGYFVRVTGLADRNTGKKVRLTNI